MRIYHLSQGLKYSFLIAHLFLRGAWPTRSKLSLQAIILTEVLAGSTHKQGFWLFSLVLVYSFSYFI